jgi:hypothetical protein
MRAWVACCLAHSCPVQAQPGVVGEVGAELDEERAEVGVDGVDVEVVDQPSGLDDPRVDPALAVVALLGPKQHRPNCTFKI